MISFQIIITNSIELKPVQLSEILNKPKPDHGFNEISRPIEIRRSIEISRPIVNITIGL